jgi:hypothetical protein
MQLYTKEELLKRAWIADSVQADIMIEAIAASYSGDINTFHCLINKVANLHWLSQRIKCAQPSIGETTTELSNKEVSQVSSITLGAYADGTNYTLTIIQTNSNGEQVVTSPSYTSVPGNTMETVINELISQINSSGQDFDPEDFELEDFSAESNIDVTASSGTQLNEIIITANPGNPLFIILLASSSQVYTLITPGLSVTKYTSSVEYSERCLTDEQIQAIVLNIELLAGSPCNCDPNKFIIDTIPNIIQFTSPIFTVPFIVNGIPAPGPGPGPGNPRDFKSPDFNNIDFR